MVARRPLTCGSPRRGTRGLPLLIQLLINRRCRCCPRESGRVPPGTGRPRRTQLRFRWSRYYSRAAHCLSSTSGDSSSVRPAQWGGYGGCGGTEGAGTGQMGGIELSSVPGPCCSWLEFGLFMTPSSPRASDHFRWCCILQTHPGRGAAIHGVAPTGMGVYGAASTSRAWAYDSMTMRKITCSRPRAFCWEAWVMAHVSAPVGAVYPTEPSWHLAHMDE